MSMPADLLAYRETRMDRTVPCQPLFSFCEQIWLDAVTSVLRAMLVLNALRLSFELQRTQVAYTPRCIGI